jgi:hypothetical protein
VEPWSIFHQRGDGARLIDNLEWLKTFRAGESAAAGKCDSGGEAPGWPGEACGNGSGEHGRRVSAQAGHLHDFAGALRAPPTLTGMSAMILCWAPGQLSLATPTTSKVSWRRAVGVP